MGAACEDGDVCTFLDTCNGIVCVGTITSCNDNNVCIDDLCISENGCVFMFNVNVCGDSCGLGVCIDGACAISDLVICDDGNSCIMDLCTVVFGCVY